MTPVIRFVMVGYRPGTISRCCPNVADDGRATITV